MAREAASAIGSSGFSGEHWLTRITQQLSDYRDEFRQHGIAMPPRPSCLPLVCAMADPSRIIDFGGSSGWCWDYLKNSLPALRISSYCVVETEAVVDFMIRSGIHVDPVSYSSLSGCIDSFDLLYCNSVLQYFGSNGLFLSLVKRSDPKYILLDDLVAKGDDDFFSVQPYHGCAMPVRFIGLKRLLQELSDSGYVEIARYPYASPIGGVVKPLEMGNFPGKNRIRYSLSVFLKRVGER